MILTSEQTQTLNQIEKWLLYSDQSYFMLTGSAGTGKTTLITNILKILEIQLDLWNLVGGYKTIDQIYITATTNKAVAVLQANLCEHTVTTIHSLLDLSISNNYKTGEETLIRKTPKIISNALIIIDEASMIDMELWNILSTSTINCKIILIGDPFQLTPVKQTESILDILNCPKMHLIDVQRHTGSILSLGLDYKEAITTGQFLPLPQTTPQVQCITGPEFKDKVDTYFHTNTNVKILAWTNQKVIQYNNYIRRMKNYSDLYEINEKLITNTPIYNGSYHYPTDSEVTLTRIIKDAVVHNVKGRWVTLDDRVKHYFLPDDPIQVKHQLKLYRKHADWSKYFNIKNDWLDLRPIYASTIHKAQGSTYHTVFIDMLDISRCTIKSITARLLYVAVTRASDKVFLYGDLAPRYYKKQV